MGLMTLKLLNVKKKCNVDYGIDWKKSALEYNAILFLDQYCSALVINTCALHIPEITTGLYTNQRQHCREK